MTLKQGHRLLLARKNLADGINLMRSTAVKKMGANTILINARFFELLRTALRELDELIEEIEIGGSK